MILIILIVLYPIAAGDDWLITFIEIFYADDAVNKTGIRRICEDAR